MSWGAAMKCTLLLILFLLPFCGCGGNSGNTQNGTAKLRVVDGIGYANGVDVLLDGGMLVSSINFLTDTGYMLVPPGQHKINASSWSIPADIAQNSQSTFVLMGWGNSGESWAAWFVDDTTPAANGNFKLRILNGTSMMLFLDGYVLPGNEVPNGTPTVTWMSQEQENPSQYLSFAPGTYHVVFTDVGTTNVEFDSGPLTFKTGQNRTFALIQNCAGNPCDWHSLTSMLLADLN